VQPELFWPQHSQMVGASVAWVFEGSMQQHVWATSLLHKAEPKHLCFKQLHHVLIFHDLYILFAFVPAIQV
jgi:hypothetical protein